jgi:hypothetical protein
VRCRTGVVPKRVEPFPDRASLHPDYATGIVSSQSTVWSA